MGEKQKSETPKKSSASELFNNIVENAIKRRERVTVVGVESAEDQIAVQNWLAEPVTQNFLQSLKKGSCKTLGIVNEIKSRDDGGYDVSYFDVNGMSIGFIYDPNEPWFKNAPDGFRVGDIILNEFKHGVIMENVKPVNLPPKTEEKVIRKLKQAFYKK